MVDKRQETIAILRGQVEATEERAPIYSKDFEAWYAAYPRKRAPGDAWRAWKAAKGKQPLAVMLRTLAAQRRSPDWTRDGGRWIPYPATYLRGRRWEERIIDDDAPAREAEPEPADPAPLVERLAPVRSGDRDRELRADFAAAFPGRPWPGRAVAFRDLVARAKVRR